MKQFRRKAYLVSICSVCLFACGGSKGGSEVSPNDSLMNDTAAVDTEAMANSDTIVVDEDYANYYIVIADTGKAYASLENEMNLLSNSLSLKVDLMNRSYNKKKDLIALPDDYKEDDIYAGDYFPRRDPSEYLSLEYLNFYNQSSEEKMIALVAGIYEKESEAQKALERLKGKEQKSFKIKAKVYVGCMH